MVRWWKNGVYSINGQLIEDIPQNRAVIGQAVLLNGQSNPRFGTIAYRILKSHIKEEIGDGRLSLRFDALVSPDNVYTSIIQTARASGMKEFPVPYILTNCHSSLCAVGGTINEDDHRFGYTSCRRYGGIFVPPYRAVLHQFMREAVAKCGEMVLGSDSHTRYGALGTLGFGEGGGELAKQLLGQGYEIPAPEVVAVKLTGKPRKGVGPHDIALALVRALFPAGAVKNKILEFVGDGIQSLSMDFRLGIDAMTTECAALSSVWETDETVRTFFRMHGREQDWKELKPDKIAYYDDFVEVELDKIRPMIALPFHPSHAFTVKEFRENAETILAETEEIAQSTMPGYRLRDKLSNGELVVRQGEVAGCAGGLYENIRAAADILEGSEIDGASVRMNLYPASQPVYDSILKNDVAERLCRVGVQIFPAFCGPCFGVLDIPANNELSIRHITRNFPNREGSRPGAGQAASVALMDARSIAATMRNRGRLTGADEIDYCESGVPESYDPSIYQKQVYWGFGEADHETEIEMGPNIADWPEFGPLSEHLLLRIAGSYDGSVTTDDLIPSGEASSYRSNPDKLSAFTLQNRDPEYAGRARRIDEEEKARKEGSGETDPAFTRLCGELVKRYHLTGEMETGSAIAAERIGDGSAREHAASSQRVLGGRANLAGEYSTKRYRSNLINWGVLPFQIAWNDRPEVGDLILLPDIRTQILEGAASAEAVWLDKTGAEKGKIILTLGPLAERERALLLAGSLINYYRKLSL